MSATFIYVLMASVENRRIPLAAYDNRSRCEDAAKNQLADELEEYGLRLSDCDHFTVEQWTLNDFLSSDTIKTLTSYDNHGKLARRLVPLGEEGKTKVERQGNRFRRLVERD